MRLVLQSPLAKAIGSISLDGQSWTIHPRFATVIMAKRIDSKRLDGLMVTKPPRKPLTAIDNILCQDSAVEKRGTCNLKGKGTEISQGNPSKERHETLASNEGDDTDCGASDPPFARQEFVDCGGLRILQHNVEGLTPEKIPFIVKLASELDVGVVLIQETHCTSSDKIDIPDFKLASFIPSKKHGIATLVHRDLKWTPEGKSSKQSETQWLCTKVQDYNIVNVYKPPRIEMTLASLPRLQAPAIYAGDFNCRHTSWGYSDNNESGNTLVHWAIINDLSLLYDPKQPHSFCSGSWKIGTNPDLAFVTTSSRSRFNRKVLRNFPKSQHRPSLIYSTKPEDERWDFEKADWDSFALHTEELVKTLPKADDGINKACQAFCNKLLNAAYKTIPYGIPSSDQVCNSLFRTFQRAAPGTELKLAALEGLRTHLDNGNEDHHQPDGVNLPNLADSIALQHVNNGKFKSEDGEFTKRVEEEVLERWGAEGPDLNLSENFSTEELAAALNSLKLDTDPGPDHICPEFVFYASDSLKAWLRVFLSFCLHHIRIPEIWQRATIIATPVPDKPLDDRKSYHTISLLCAPFKILEHLIYSRIESVIHPQLPLEQFGFRSRWSAEDQVTLLTQDVEDCFEKGQKAGAVFIGVTDAYDTVWHDGLAYKLLELLPDKHMVRMIMQLMGNQSFVLKTNYNQSSSLQKLENGLPQGSILAPLLFSIYTYDLPTSTAKKYIHADELAILQAGEELEHVEEVLKQDSAAICGYSRKWRLKVETVATLFHLYNEESERKLNINIEYQATPTFLDVMLDRTLTYSQHLENLLLELSSRIALMSHLAKTDWGARPTTLRTILLELVYALAEYCGPLWAVPQCWSALLSQREQRYNKALRARIKNTARIDEYLDYAKTKCLQPTQRDSLSDIESAEARRNNATISLYERALEDPGHLLHQLVKGKKNRRLKRLPFVEAARELLKDNDD